MDTEVTSKRPSTLKKCLYVGLGFGSGAVLMSAVIVGSFVWYSNHPKPWNTDAIKASFSQETYGLINNDFNITEMTLEYFIDNKTTTDYTLSPTYAFMIVDKGAIAPSANGLYKLSESCFVPSGNRAKCSVAVSPDYDTSVNLDGFVIFDTTNRYKIEFPKPLRPSPEEKKEFIATFTKSRSKIPQKSRVRFIPDQPTRTPRVFKESDFDDAPSTSREKTLYNDTSK